MKKRVGVFALKICYWDGIVRMEMVGQPNDWSLGTGSVTIDYTFLEKHDGHWGGIRLLGYMIKKITLLNVRQCYMASFKMLQSLYQRYQQ